MTEKRASLIGYCVFAGLLAMAGLPIYLHAPKFYVDTYGVSLGALGAVLVALRLVDVVQDPVLGWLSDRFRAFRGRLVAGALVALGAAMLGLFAVVPPVAPLLWFALMLTILFSAYSLLTICFYAQGVEKAGLPGVGGHVRLASWRETGALVGVCLAAIAPTFLGFAGFATGVAMLALAAGLVMRDQWSGATQGMPAGRPSSALRGILGDPLARRLLLIALVNAAPLAVTSTLFLFFVDMRLQAGNWAGPLLVLFFAAAALTAPLWGRLAGRIGPRPVLLTAMGLSVAAFGGAALLGAGDILAFAVVCVVSGATLGADLTLLPAMFAGRLAQIGSQAGQGFGLWAFVSKLTLALAAGVLLPMLQAVGVGQVGESPARGLVVLSLLYALLPCALKLIAIALLAATPLTKEVPS